MNRNLVFEERIKQEAKKKWPQIDDGAIERITDFVLQMMKLIEEEKSKQAEEQAGKFDPRVQAMRKKYGLRT